MKIFSGLLTLVLLALILAFALSNDGRVTLALWPLEGEAQMPLYVLGLAPLLGGLLLGGLWGGLMGLSFRFKARRLCKEILRLNDRIEALEKTQTSKAPLRTK